MREAAELILELCAGDGAAALTRHIVLSEELLPDSPKEFTMKLSLPPSEGRMELYLRMEQKKDGEPICFANRPEAERVYLGAICED